MLYYCLVKTVASDVVEVCVGRLQLSYGNLEDERSVVCSHCV